MFDSFFLVILLLTSSVSNTVSYHKLYGLVDNARRDVQKCAAKRVKMCKSVQQYPVVFTRCYIIKLDCLYPTIIM
jgi:hypothetical protein